MGKRINKTTKFVVDISKALNDAGLPAGLALELALVVKHPKNIDGLSGHFSKKVTVDFTKVKE